MKKLILLSLTITFLSGCGESLMEREHRHFKDSIDSVNAVIQKKIDRNDFLIKSLSNGKKN